MKIFSLNVNGLRAFDEKNGSDFNKFCLETLQADIICLQEIKGSESSLAKYHSLMDYQTFSSFYQKGRHGVSTLIKKNLYCEKIEEIVPGRILKTYHGSFVIYNCYMPYHDETTDDDKTDKIKIYDDLREELPLSNVIFCGDFNATYNMLDHYQFVNELNTLVENDAWISHSKLLALPEIKKIKEDSVVSAEVKKKVKLWNSITTSAEEYMDYSMVKDKVEKIRPSKTELPYYFFSVKALEKYFYEVYQREWMRKIAIDYIDTFRLFNKELSKYTCWNTIFNLRSVNLGTRIDYILCSKDIKCISSGIVPEIKGSDHCPVFAKFEIEKFEGKAINLVKRKNNLLEFLQVKK